MIIKDVPLPEEYLVSQDFRFFVDWVAHTLDRYKYEHENFMDLYDPLRIPEHLLWALADTMGYKFDDRLPTSFNRLVLLYFISMIKNRGSKDGVTLAAQTNLAQFNILMKAQGFTDINGKIYPPNDILYNRLEDPTIPVNAVYVSVYTEKGYIDIVYFSDKVPLDACLEYVRPVGMYAFQHAGVRFDAKTKVSIDSRLTNTRDAGMSFGPTHVGHYRRKDYASMQLTRQKLNDTMPLFRVRRVPNTSRGKWFVQEYIDREDNLGWKSVYGPFESERIATSYFEANMIEPRHTRENVWYRNREGESGVLEPPTSYASNSFQYQVNGEDYVMNPGYRTLYSLQLCNNENITKSLFDEPIFSLGYGPQDVETKRYDDDYMKYPYRDKYEDGTFEEPESYIDREGISNRRVLGSKVYNLRVDRDLEESRIVPNLTTYAIDGEGDEWYLLKDGKRLEPGKVYAERRIAEIRLAVLVPPDVYTVEARHPSHPERTDIADQGTADYEVERINKPNVTKPRPAVNPIMASLGDSLSMDTMNTEYMMKERNTDGIIEDDTSFEIKPNTEL